MDFSYPYVCSHVIMSIFSVYLKIYFQSLWLPVIFLKAKLLSLNPNTSIFNPKSCPFRNEGVSTRSDPWSLRNNNHMQSTNMYSTPFSCSSSSSVLKLYVLIKGNLNFPRLKLV